MSFKNIYIKLCNCLFIVYKGELWLVNESAAGAIESHLQLLSLFPLCVVFTFLRHFVHGFLLQDNKMELSELSCSQVVCWIKNL